jgi:hypothetical protein
MNQSQSMMSCDSSATLTGLKTGGIISIKKPKKLTITEPVKPVKELDIESASSTEIIEKMVKDEIALEKLKHDIESTICTDGKQVLEHLGDYIEEPYHLIESYFQGQHLERLVRHQIESYNHFINYQVQRTIQMFNPVNIR